jgi:hypothetical protein
MIIKLWLLVASAQRNTPDFHGLLWQGIGFHLEINLNIPAISDL